MEALTTGGIPVSFDEGDAPFLTPRGMGTLRAYAAVGDYNEDGLLETFGLINNGDGTFSDAPYVNTILPVLNQYPGRVDRDNRAFDINGDGHLDVIANVYADPTHANSFTLIFYGDGTGGFSSYEERRDIDGFGETIVVADFDNDNDSDVFLPVYTHILGNDSNYLLINENGTLGQNEATEWGVAMSGQSYAFRVEGAQAADINFDGKIDLFVASHLFINEGGSFRDTTLPEFFFDEGASLFDYDNDGDFDLVLRSAYGSSTAPRLYRWDGDGFTDQGYIPGTEGLSTNFGIKVYDIDSNGWEDVVLPTSQGLTILFNTQGVFTRYDMPLEQAQLQIMEDRVIVCDGMVETCSCGLASGYFDTLAFFDYDDDGRPDLIGHVLYGNPSLYLFENNLAAGETLTMNIVGANGELNQHGRPVVLTPVADPSIEMARVVDSGSGYMSQNQYELLIGLPIGGEYEARITFAFRTVEFTVSSGTETTAFADGRLEITGDNAANFLGGADAADVLAGGGGADVVYASAGADQSDGGSGNDLLDFSRVGGGIEVDLAAGTARVGGVAQIATNFERVIGTASADLIAGSAQATALAGGAGDDIYVVVGAETVIEAANGGTDEVRTALATYALTDNVERLIGTSASGQLLIGNAAANYFAGGGGADRFEGGLGNDTYLVGAGDVVVELADGGYDEVQTELAAYVLPNHVERLIGLAAAGQQLTGNALDNAISGLGADEMRGGAGNDIYIVSAGDVVIENAGEGIDEVRTALASYTLTANVERLIGTAATGQELIGNAGANYLTGGAGADILRGNGGDDIYVVGAGDLVVENAGGGIDEVRTDLGVYTLGANVENLTGTSTQSQKLIGNALDNVLRSPAPYSTLYGLGGNDIYYVVGFYDFVAETAGQGYDIVRTTGAYQLSTGQEIEQLEVADAASTHAVTLYGNALNNLLIGNAGANLLVGSGGIDTLRGLDGDDTLSANGASTLAGGRGNDILYIDSPNAIVIELANEGFDVVYAASTYTLGAGVAVEVLANAAPFGTAPVTLTGNELANSIRGNAGANILDGGGGADQLIGFGGNDVYVVDNAGDQVFEQVGDGLDRVLTSVNYILGAGSEIEALTAANRSGTAALALVGNEFGNVVEGNAGANAIDGARGADRLYGFGGNDTYYVDSAQDQVFETAGQGTDIVYTTVSYTLAAGTSVEVLAARAPFESGALDLTGNELANVLRGNQGANILVGGAGADTMYGFGGDDIYYVDNALDVVFEAAGEGFDQVRSSVSYTLTAGMHIEQLSTTNGFGTEAINLTGNGLANALLGNYGANVLNGGDGADRMTGFGGDDVYIVDNALDVIMEAANEGFDRVRTTVDYTLTSGSHIELLEAANGYSFEPLRLTGNQLANTIRGNQGDNVINGGAGADLLYGFGGADTFAFTTALGSNNVDRIADFTPGTDRIALDHTIFAGLTVGALASAAFVLGASAGDASDRILYNSVTGALYFDVDGIGGTAAVVFAIASPNLALTAADFAVV